MLEKMRIKMSSAKALKYFKMCDVDDSGEIDFEESPSAGRSSNGRLQMGARRVPDHPVEQFWRRSGVRTVPCGSVPRRRIRSGRRRA